MKKMIVASLMLTQSMVTSTEAPHSIMEQMVQIACSADEGAYNTILNTIKTIHEENENILESEFGPLLYATDKLARILDEQRREESEQERSNEQTPHTTHEQTETDTDEWIELCAIDDSSDLNKWLEDRTTQILSANEASKLRLIERLSTQLHEIFDERDAIRLQLNHLMGLIGASDEIYGDVTI